MSKVAVLIGEEENGVGHGYVTPLKTRHTSWHCYRRHHRLQKYRHELVTLVMFANAAVIRRSIYHWRHVCRWFYAAYRLERWRDVARHHERVGTTRMLFG